MNVKRIVALLAMIAIVAVASSAVTDTDGASSDSQDGKINVVVEGGSPIHVSLDSGQSKTVRVYVHNGLYDAAVIEVDPISGFGDDVHSTVVQSVSHSDSSDLVMGLGDTAIITVALKADNYADTSAHVGVLSFTVVDLTSADRSTGFSETITVDITSVFVDDHSYNKFFGVFPNTFDYPLNSPWFAAAVTIILWIVATIIVSELIIPLFSRLAGSRKTLEEKKSLTKRLTTTITAIMFVIAFNECAQILGANAEVSHFIRALSSVIYVVLGATIAWQLYTFIVSAFLKGLDESADVDGMDMSLFPLFKMIGKIAISVVAVCTALAAFGVDLAGIMVSAGVVTLGITLGAQNTLNQFFSGIVLLATRPFHKGDFVKIGTESYVVRKVKLMYTEFENWDKDQIVTIPNNVVSSATLVNLTKDHHRTRVFIYIDVAYGSDLDKVKECLARAGAKHPHVITDGSCTPPSPRLVEFADSGITFRLACYVDDYDNSSHYAGQIRELVWKELTDNGIEVPFSRIQVDILSEPGNGKRPDDSA